MCHVARAQGPRGVHKEEAPIPFAPSSDHYRNAAGSSVDAESEALAMQAYYMSQSDRMCLCCGSVAMPCRCLMRLK